MTLLLSCAWDHARIGTASLRFTTATSTYGPISFTTGRHSHVSAASLTLMGTGGGTYDTGIVAGTFASQLQALMDAAAPETVTVSRSSTGQYTLACTGATFSLDFTTDGAAGTRMRQILGMTGNRSGSTSYTSQCFPKYLIAPLRQGRTAYTGVKAVTSGMRQWKTDNGAVGSLGPTYLPRMARWEHHFEPEARVWHRMADADTVVFGHQYTWEALSDDAYQIGELCFVEDTVTPTESFGFYLTSSPVGEELRPIRPEMRRFVVGIDAQVMGRMP